MLESFHLFLSLAWKTVCLWNCSRLIRESRLKSVIFCHAWTTRKTMNHHTADRHTCMFNEVRIVTVCVFFLPSIFALRKKGEKRPGWTNRRMISRRACFGSQTEEYFVIISYHSLALLSVGWWQDYHTRLVCVLAANAQVNFHTRWFCR